MIETENMWKTMDNYGIIFFRLQNLSPNSLQSHLSEVVLEILLNLNSNMSFIKKKISNLISKKFLKHGY